MFESIPRHPMRLLVGLVAILVILSQTLAIVPEDKQALILRFGEIERTVNRYKPHEEFGRSGAGLVLRVPFTDGIQYIDKRILGINMERQQVLSTDQQRLQVDAFARFRITNPVRMYTAIRTEDTLLSPERGAGMDNIQVALNREAHKYGAEIIDVRIKRADLPEGATLQAAYDRMRTARQQEAIAIRAEGQKEAQIIRGNADGEAARIYAASFGKDPEFYDFYRAMQSYRQTFLGENNKGGTSIIMSPDNEYLKRFSGG